MQRNNIYVKFKVTGTYITTVIIHWEINEVGLHRLLLTIENIRYLFMFYVFIYSLFPINKVILISLTIDVIGQ